MKLLFVLLLFSGFVRADEFDWERPDAKFSKLEFPTPAGPIQVIAGSLCGVGIYCEIAVKYVNANNEELVIIHEMANSMVTLALVDDEIEISSVYYLYGSEEGEKVTYRYGWGERSEKLELKGKHSQKVKE